MDKNITPTMDIQQISTAYTIKNDKGTELEVKELTFDSYKIRVAWSRDEEKFYFSIVDCVGLLTEQPTAERAGTYWRVMKKRLKEEGSEIVTNCNGLKLRAADGKGYRTDVADTEQLLRIIQSVPSKKAEPFKLWLARLGQERLNQMQDPELNIEQTPVELMLNGLAEAATTEISQDRNPQTFGESAQIAQEGGEVADAARQNLEHRLGRSVLSKNRAINFTTPADELPLPKSEEDMEGFEEDLLK